MTFEFAEVVLVRFPFSDQSGAKQRPAVVVSSAAYTATRGDVIAMAITSRFRRGADVGDIIVEAWQFAGLVKPSAIKLNIATFDVSIIMRKLGELALRDRQTLRQAISKLFPQSS